MLDRLKTAQKECEILWKRLHPKIPYSPTIWNAFLPSSTGLHYTWQEINRETKEYSGQMHWGVLCTRAALRAAIRLKERIDTSLIDSHRFLAGQRREIGAILNQDPTGKLDIGIPRTELFFQRYDVLHTYLDTFGRYADQFPAVRQRILDLMEAHPKIANPTYRVHTEVGNYKTEDHPIDYRTDSVAIANGYITTVATLYRHYEYKNRKINQPNYIERIIIAHPSPIIAETGIVDHLYATLATPALQFLSQKILTWETQRANVELYHHLGALAWYIGPSVSLSTGSAATADMLLKSLLILHGFTPLAFKPGVNWDIRTMLHIDMYACAEDYYHIHQHTAPRLREDPFTVRNTDINYIAEMEKDVVIEEFKRCKNTIAVLGPGYTVLENERVIHHDYIYPVFPVCPSHPEETAAHPLFYPPIQRAQLNRMGKMAFERYREIVKRQCIAFLKENKLPDFVITHCEKPGGFYSIYLSRFNDYSIKLNDELLDTFKFRFKLNDYKIITYKIETPEEIRLDFLRYEAIAENFYKATPEERELTEKFLKETHWLGHFSSWECTLKTIDTTPELKKIFDRILKHEITPSVIAVPLDASGSESKEEKKEVKKADGESSVIQFHLLASGGNKNKKDQELKISHSEEKTVPTSSLEDKDLEEGWSPPLCSIL